MRARYSISIIIFLLLFSCNKEPKISGYWFGKHQIINGITSEFEYSRELFNFGQDSLRLTNMYFDRALNNYISKTQAYYNIDKSFLHCDLMNQFDSVKIELLTNDTLQLKMNESVICFSKIDQYGQSESIELLKEKLNHNALTLDDSENSWTVKDIGYSLYSIKDINKNIDKGTMKMFRAGTELFISLSGLHSELLQVKSVSSESIECVNHIPIPTSYKIKLDEFEK